MSSIESSEKTKKLKEVLLRKLDTVKWELNKIKTNINNNISEERESLKKGHQKYISSYNKKYSTLIKDKKDNNNKSVQCFEYWKIMNEAKDIESFTVNLYDIAIHSLENYSMFLLNQIPYFKKTATNFMINESPKLGYNHIFSKLTKNQVDKLHEKIYSKKILYFLNCNYSVNTYIDPEKLDITDKALLDSISFYKLNKLEIKKTDQNLKEFFDEDSFFDNKRAKLNELLFNSCNLKDVELHYIPYNVKHLFFMNSIIPYTCFNNTRFNDLVTLNLDNNDIDTNNFEAIFLMLFQNKKVCNNLKVLSASNNNISRIVKDEDLENIKNKLESLETFNLSFNNIYQVNLKLFELIPNIKVFDLSNNSINREILCRNLVKICPGFMILINNIGIMKDSFNKLYIKYYCEKISSGKYPIKSINTDSLFYKRNFSEIFKINFTNIQKKQNITEINLTSSYIDNNSVMKIFNSCIKSNNNITKINLSRNPITHEFYGLITKYSLSVLLEKLVELDLSFTKIDLVKESKVKDSLFIPFVNNFKYIYWLNISGTPLEEKFNEYIKLNVNRYYQKEKKMKLSNIEGMNLQIKEILEQHLQIKNNFHFVMIATKHDKYYKKTEIILPFFAEHFDIIKIQRKQ